MTKEALAKDALLSAVQAALAGDWDKSHNIAQDYSDNTANWLHAVLHKIEGDEWNSKYWYARTHGKNFERVQTERRTPDGKPLTSFQVLAMNMWPHFREILL